MFKDVILGIKAKWIEDDDFKIKLSFCAVWFVCAVCWLPFLWSASMPIVLTFLGGAFFGFITTALTFVFMHGLFQAIYDAMRYVEHLRQKGEEYRIEKQKEKPVNGME